MNLNLIFGGQFRPASGGQFQPALGGQFKSARGGQFHRFLQLRKVLVVSYGMCTEKLNLSTNRQDLI